MLKKPVAIIVLLALGVIAAFVGAFYLQVREPKSPNLPVLDEVGQKQDGKSSSATGSGGGASRPSGGSVGQRTPRQLQSGSGSTATAGSVPSSDQPASQPAAGTGATAAPPAGNGAGPAQAAPAPRPKQLTLPAGTEFDIQLDTAMSSEINRVEDRIDAHVTNNVSSGVHLAIPAQTPVVGWITIAEKGGGVSKPARLAVRFSKLLVPGALEILIDTDQILSEAEAPTGDTKKKVGMGAGIGAVVGLFTGGTEGAIKGGAAGAGAALAGSAVANKPKSVVIPKGQVTKLRLKAPITIIFDK